MLRFPLRLTKWLLSGRPGITITFLTGTVLGGMTIQFAHSQAPTQAQPDEYVLINFMKTPPQGDSAYLALERETQKPIMQERIRRGRLKRWAVYQVLQPRGEDREFNYITMDVHASYAATAPATAEDTRINREIIAGVHPGLTAERHGAQITAARRLIKGQLLRLVAETH
jgi:hypothetical protein